MVSVRYVYAILLQNCILIKNCLKICDDLFVIFLIYFYKAGITETFSIPSWFSCLHFAALFSYHIKSFTQGLLLTMLTDDFGLAITKVLTTRAGCWKDLYVVKVFVLLHHLLSAVLKNRLNFCHHEVNGHMILTAFWDDDIGVSFWRFNELIVHRSDDRYILFNHGINRSASFFRIT